MLSVCSIWVCVPMYCSVYSLCCSVYSVCCSEVQWVSVCDVAKSKLCTLHVWVGATCWVCEYLYVTFLKTSQDMCGFQNISVSHTPRVGWRYVLCLVNIYMWPFPRCAERWLGPGQSQLRTLHVWVGEMCWVSKYLNLTSLKTCRKIFEFGTISIWNITGCVGFRI